MKKYITRIYGMAGTVEKADRDFADFAEEIGFENIPIHRYNDSKETDREMSSRIDGILGRVARGDMIIHQYPTWNSPRFEKRLLQKMQSWGLICGAMIHDIPNWVNGPSKWNSTFPEEHAMRYDFLIVHTKRMADEFRKRGYDKPIFENIFFDYASDMPINEMTFEKQVYTAGNPRKAKALLAWDNDAKLLMYGGNPDNFIENNMTGRNIVYKGMVPADELPREFTGGFGLVYYQDIPEEDNWSARYAGFNGPHKLSSYLAAGLPVIVESYMPSADFIVAHKLGFVIDDITQVDAKIAELSAKDYAEMVAATKRFAGLLRSGYFTKRVMSEVAAFAFTENTGDINVLRY
ncbi:hypothetical protein [Pseudolactococcus insecticola]|uniref:Beta-1,6-galactofuranosyltransferase n=1 Tax=Pseudolactococcus insecticola TaxID=2709158 RepID=A0A6A0B6Q4_9LACT|nr:hypothetical protein [Lactococcus insecticola]GFH40952.1 beta-1,6-galactofuranosyltransferase [Lactococcus insecticola]